MVTSNRPHIRSLTSFFLRRLVLLVLLTLLSAALSPICAQVESGAQKKVLVLHLMRRNDTSTLANERTYQKVLNDGLAGQIDYYSEYVDLARFGGDDYQNALRNFFRQKYKGTDFDVIIANNTKLKNILILYCTDLI